jgi:hypothetical protein
MPQDAPETLEAYIEGEKQSEAAFRPITIHLDTALANLGTLGDLARRRRDPAQRATWTHHHGYLGERIRDVRIITGRMAEAKHEFSRRQLEEKLSDGIDPSLGIILPTQMKLDFESLFIFGNLALDQLAMLANTLTREPTGDLRYPFNRLVEMFEVPGYAGVLLPVWERHRSDIVWLYYHVRRVRNTFVEHLNLPFQRSPVSTFYGPDFELFMPALVEDGSTPSVGEAMERAIRQLGSRHVPHVSREEWDEYGFPYVLRRVFDSIDALDTRAEREQVWEACQYLGVHTPPYHIIGVRLARFLDASLRTVSEIIGANPN